MLQKNGYDVDKKLLFANLLQFDPSENNEPVKIKGTKSKYEDFGGLNAFILTNALNEPLKINLVSRFNDYEDSNEESEIIFDKDWGKSSETSEVEDTSTLKDFCETWIFQTFKVNELGQSLLSKQVPDSITSWVFTGFSLNEKTGLEIYESQTLVVKQKLFLKLNLPHSIRCGEILKVEILVFNYVPDRKINLSVDVELFRNETHPDFDFLDKGRKCTYEVSTNNTRSNFISVAQNSMVKTFFFIKTLRTGIIKLKVRASGQQVKFVDEVEKEILIEHHGITHYDNLPIMIDLVKGEFYTYRYDFPLPYGTIPKSVKIGASIVGDLIRPMLLDALSLL